MIVALRLNVGTMTVTNGVIDGRFSEVVNFARRINGAASNDSFCANVA